MTTPSAIADAAGERRGFATLDGLRGVAAATVVVYHFPALWTPFAARSGYLAVDLFFLMSGFIVEHAYGARLAAGLTAGRFIRLRLIRLYPLYALGTGITVVAIAAALLKGNYAVEWTWPALAGAIASAALMLPAQHLQHTTSLFPLNVPAWSLFYELLVNMLFAAWYRLWTPGRLATIVAAAMLGIGYSGWANAGLDLGSSHGSLACFAAVARVAFSFFLGVLAYRKGWHGRRSVAWMSPALLLGVTLLLLVAPTPVPDRGLTDFLTVVFAFPLILAAAVTTEPRGRRGRRACAVLGLTSYAVYVVHEPLLRLLMRIDGHVLGGWIERSAPYGGVASLLGILVVAAGVDLAYDRPVRRWLSGRPAPRRNR